jgi:hypothetical protein
VEQFVIRRALWSITFRTGSRFAGAKKEKPGGGNAGSDFFVIGVYGFKYAAWLSFIPPEGGETVVFLVQPIFFFFFSFLVLLLRF